MKMLPKNDADVSSSNSNKAHDHYWPNVNVQNETKQAETDNESATNISIKTLEENEENSSVIESDSEIEYDEFDESKRTRALSTGTDVVIIEDDVRSNNEDTRRNTSLTIGSVAVQNSSEITFGNKTYYQGPVTIKQYTKVYENGQNPAYEPNETDETSVQETVIHEGKSPLHTAQTF